MFGCGHPRTPENAIRNGGDKVCCKTCKYAREAARRAADPERERARVREAQRRSRGGLRGHRNSRKGSCPQGHDYTPENTYLYRGDRQCKTCRREHAATWRAKNGQYIAEKNQAYYAANGDVMRESARRWQQENRDRANLTSRLKKQRRRAAGVLTPDEWLAVLDEFGHICLACGSDGPLTVDHVIPISTGGLNVRENVQPLCGPCNSSKGAKSIDYRRKTPVAS